jgi:predicted DNA-binding mobile mystery protein A
MDRRQAAFEARRSLDHLLGPYRELSRRRPPRGWIRAIRDALGMTAGQLGARMDVSQPAVQTMEASEARGTIQLDTLRRAAEALDCELVYVLLPRRPLRQMYEERAHAVAQSELSTVSQTMALEDQAVDDADEQERLRRFIEQELDPRSLWSRR